MANLFSQLPKMDELLIREKVILLIDGYSRKTVMEAIRISLDQLRQMIRDGLTEEGFSHEMRGLDERIAGNLELLWEPHLKRVINGTGVVIHTNLGRSPVNSEILQQMAAISQGYSNLEYALEEGTRGSRYSHLEEILQRITGSESAMVVNNNAAAVLLILSTLAKGREVLTSRGELIEIGGAFRIPDVCEQSGATLIEVGTTNKTHLRDYENAISENTAAVLKVHTSNYRIMGFTEAVDTKEMMHLKESHGIYIIEDLGSGVLIDLSKYGLEYEPTVRDVLERGVDVVSFSGDKLLGGPQAGVICGKKEIIDQIKKNPLTRALRVDKFTISALESTLRYYIDEELAIRQIPTLRMLVATEQQLRERAENLKAHLEGANLSGFEFNLLEMESEVGGGSLPMCRLLSYGLTVERQGHSANQLECGMRSAKIPVIGRIIKDRFAMDIRTIDDAEFEIIEQALKGLGD